jgi:hypothetical protein
MRRLICIGALALAGCTKLEGSPGVIPASVASTAMPPTGFVIVGQDVISLPMNSITTIRGRNGTSCVVVKGSGYEVSVSCDFVKAPQ